MGKHKKISLLIRILIAIVLGCVCSLFIPFPIARIFQTINVIFSQYLTFVIPLIILGLVAPGIAEMGNGAGKLLGFTVLIAYGSTLAAGFFSYISCLWSFPWLMSAQGSFDSINTLPQEALTPYFVIDMPPLMEVMTALLLSFVLGLGVVAAVAQKTKSALMEMQDITMKVIQRTIVPFLPLYIFCIFLKIGVEGVVTAVISLFLKIIILIFVMHVLLLLFQYVVAGIVARKNPFMMLRTMMPAYMTALGTQSSAATIPVTLSQTLKLGIDPEVAGFVIPLNATIHLSGSILKIVACAMAISWVSGTSIGLDPYAGFIMMLGVAMVAAPGVPGGAIMAAIGLLQSMLGFNDAQQGLMIALYISMDSFGTACNVTGDGALAVILDRIYKNKSVSQQNNKECIAGLPPAA